MPVRGRSVDFMRFQEHGSLEGNKKVLVRLGIGHCLDPKLGVRSYEQLGRATRSDRYCDAQLPVAVEPVATHDAQDKVSAIDEESEILKRSYDGAQRLFLVSGVKGARLIGALLHLALIGR